MLAPVGDHDIVASGKEQCGDEIEDQRRDEQPQKQEQRPVRSVTPAVLHPPGDNYCQKHVHHPKRVHPIGWRAGAGLKKLAEPAHQPGNCETGDNRGENTNTTKWIHPVFRLRPSISRVQITGNGPKPPGRFVLPSGCAGHSFCTAVFCSPRGGRCGFAFPCFALPRRHCSTARSTLGCQPKCLDDQSLGRFPSLLYFPNLLLARDSLSICSDWYVFWSHSRLARFGDDPLGKPTGRTFLHSESLARDSRHAGNRSTFCLRLVARHALRQQRSRRATLGDDRLRNGAFSGGRRRVNSLLSRLLHWSASASRASRATAHKILTASPSRHSHFLDSWLPDRLFPLLAREKNEVRVSDDKRATHRARDRREQRDRV